MVLWPSPNMAIGLLTVSCWHGAWNLIVICAPGSLLTFSRMQQPAVRSPEVSFGASRNLADCMAGDTLPQKRDNDVVSCVFLSHLAANYAPDKSTHQDPRTKSSFDHYSWQEISPSIVMNRCSLQSQDFPTMFHYQSDPGHVNQVKPISAACLVISRF